MTFSFESWAAGHTTLDIRKFILPTYDIRHSNVEPPEIQHAILSLSTNNIPVFNRSTYGVWHSNVEADGHTNDIRHLDGKPFYKWHVHIWMYSRWTYHIRHLNFKWLYFDMFECSGVVSPKFTMAQLPHFSFPYFFRVPNSELWKKMFSLFIWYLGNVRNRSVKLNRWRKDERKVLWQITDSL